ncbi:DUF4124 domain-containing protein [Dyella sp. C11]|uniref:DUF4124 domain-containing protein n=1 Tax=Dyella sp. C11 TaxID=2126991 RepID=UPI000D644580|nr:DUF4124 domain-containing protein [Dyella sp. C11]
MMRACLILLLFLLPLSAMAQAGIHRCVGADGNPVFTDQPCAFLQATPVNTPPPATAAAPMVQGAADIPATTPPPVSCATSVASLRQSTIDAFAAHDPNRLAGLMIWNGYGREAVVADIRSLGSLMQRPLLDVGASDEEETSSSSPGTDGDASTTDASPRPSSGGGEPMLLVHTASNDGSGTPHETRFSIVRRSGCLWLRGSG